MERGFLSYGDCGRFEGCRDAITLTSSRLCRRSTQRLLPREPRRRFRMRGALVLYTGPLHVAYVVSGRTVTGIRVGDPTRLAEVRRIVRQLRPYRAASARGRLAPPSSC